MRKIVVFDSGCGGEAFADRLERELPVLEVIRAIDWRDAEKINHSARKARKAAEEVLLPYIGTVDLIIFANHLLSFASLKYFRHKYPEQAFLGLSLPKPVTKATRTPALVFTTTPVARTMEFQKYLYNLRRPTTVFYLDDWPELIDAGTFDKKIVQDTLSEYFGKDELPHEILLAHTHFSDVAHTIRRACGWRLVVSDGMADTIIEICRLLKIRGGTIKKRK